MKDTMKKTLWLFCLIFILSCSGIMTVSAAGFTGLKTVNGIQYYYKNGAKVKDKLGIKIKNKYYQIDAKGIAKEVSKADGLAGIFAEKNHRNLKQAFQSIANMKYASVGKMSDSEYACYGFAKNRADCKVQALCFAYVAKVLGKENVSYVKGYVLRKGNKLGSHAWVTIKEGNTVYVYDPSLAQYLKQNKISVNYAYRFQYGAKKTYTYYNSKKNKITK